MLAYYSIENVAHSVLPGTFSYMFLKPPNYQQLKGPGS